MVGRCLWLLAAISLGQAAQGPSQGAQTLKSEADVYFETLRLADDFEKSQMAAAILSGDPKSVEDLRKGKVFTDMDFNPINQKFQRVPIRVGRSQVIDSRFRDARDGYKYGFTNVRPIGFHHPVTCQLLGAGPIRAVYEICGPAGAANFREALEFHLTNVFHCQLAFELATLPYPLNVETATHVYIVLDNRGQEGLGGVAGLRCRVISLVQPIEALFRGFASDESNVVVEGLFFHTHGEWTAAHAKGRDPDDNLYTVMPRVHELTALGIGLLRPTPTQLFVHHVMLAAEDYVKEYGTYVPFSADCQTFTTKFLPRFVFGGPTIFAFPFVNNMNRLQTVSSVAYNVFDNALFRACQCRAYEAPPGTTLSMFTLVKWYTVCPPGTAKITDETGLTKCCPNCLPQGARAVPEIAQGHEIIAPRPMIMDRSIDTRRSRGQD